MMIYPYFSFHDLFSSHCNKRIEGYLMVTWLNCNCCQWKRKAIPRALISFTRWFLSLPRGKLGKVRIIENRWFWFCSVCVVMIAEILQEIVSIRGFQINRYLIFYTKDIWYNKRKEDCVYVFTMCFVMIKITENVPWKFILGQIQT